MGHAEAGADPGDEGGFGGAFGAQAVVDGGGGDLAGEGGPSEQQQRQAVRAAGDGDSEPAGRGAGQRFEVGAEAGDASGRGRRYRHRTCLDRPAQKPKHEGLAS